MVSVLGRLPKKGDELEIGDYRVTVEAMDRRRIRRLRFERHNKDQNAPPSE